MLFIFWNLLILVIKKKLSLIVYKIFNDNIEQKVIMNIFIIFGNLEKKIFIKFIIKRFFYVFRLYSSYNKYRYRYYEIIFENLNV